MCTVKLIRISRYRIKVSNLEIGCDAIPQQQTH